MRERQSGRKSFYEFKFLNREHARPLVRKNNNNTRLHAGMYVQTAKRFSDKRFRKLFNFMTAVSRQRYQHKIVFVQRHRTNSNILRCDTNPKRLVNWPFDFNAQRICTWRTRHNDYLRQLKHCLLFNGKMEPGDTDWTEGRVSRKP